MPAQVIGCHGEGWNEAHAVMPHDYRPCFLQAAGLLHVHACVLLIVVLSNSTGRLMARCPMHVWSPCTPYTDTISDAGSSVVDVANAAVLRTNVHDPSGAIQPSTCIEGHMIFFVHARTMVSSQPAPSPPFRFYSRCHGFFLSSSGLLTLPVCEGQNLMHTAMWRLNGYSHVQVRFPGTGPAGSACWVMTSFCGPLESSVRRSSGGLRRLSLVQGKQSAFPDEG